LDFSCFVKPERLSLWLGTSWEMSKGEHQRCGAASFFTGSLLRLNGAEDNLQYDCSAPVSKTKRKADLLKTARKL